MACSGDGLLACNNWIALLLYFFMTVCGALLLLLCYGICRQLWYRARSSGDGHEQDYVAYKYEQDAAASINSQQISECDVGYMERNPHAQSDSEQDNGSVPAVPVPASGGGTPRKVGAGGHSEEFLPPYTPPTVPRARHGSTVTYSSSRSTSSKPPLNSSTNPSQHSHSTTRGVDHTQVEYSTAV